MAPKTTVVLLTVMATTSACGLGGPSDDDLSRGPSGTTGENRARDPFEGELPRDAALRQNVLERRAIFEGNAIATRLFSEAMNRELVNAGVSARFAMTAMSPSAPPAAELMDVVVPPGQGPGRPPEGSGGDTCAYAAPEGDGAEVSCRFLASRAFDSAFIRRVQALAESPLPSTFTTEAPAPELVQSWYEQALDFGLDQSSVYAVDALRSARVCDVSRSAADDPFERGVELGRTAMRTRVAAVSAETPRTRCDTDAAIIDPATRRAMDDVPTLVADNPLCAGFVAPDRDAATNLERASMRFRTGIETGIAEAATTESGRLVREWSCTPPDTGGGRDDGGGGGGGGSDGGGRGDPLVLDLDGNGVHVDPLALGPVFELGFHGRARLEWPSTGDAFLVIDRDGDGHVDGTELFGDVTARPEGSFALDGFEALAVYDAVGEGGNGDGVIDRQDEMYDALAAWSDRDGDGVADPGELASLAALGIGEIDLDGQSFERRDGSRGVAADVWLRYERAR